MPLHSLSDYARALRPELGPKAFEPVASRVLWLLLHVAIAAAAITLLAVVDLPWPVKALLSLPIGIAFAGMAFVAHETLHGAVVREPRLRRLVGGVGFLPFVISPRHWVGWHNRLHHGHTTTAKDPDAFPTIEHYRASLVARVADRISLGGHRVAGLFTLVVGLVVQSMEVLFISGPRSGYLPPRQRAWALAETAAALGFWVGLAVWLGGDVLVFGWLLPLALGNVVVMAHILTNHSLSPLNEINDPLSNSLSVTVPRWFSTYSLQFGYHVEHHMFPSISGRHARRVRDLIRERWPERYRSMPLAAALRRIFGTGRIYKDPTTLVDPRSGVEAPTI